MEAFSLVVEKPKLAQDVCLSNLCQISASDTDHNYMFFLHTLDSSKKIGVF